MTGCRCVFWSSVDSHVRSAPVAVAPIPRATKVLVARALSRRAAPPVRALVEARATFHLHSAQVGMPAHRQWGRSERADSRRQAEAPHQPAQAEQQALR